MVGGPTHIRVRLKYPDLDTFVARYSSRLTAKGLFLVVRNPSPPGTLVRFELVLLTGSTVLAGNGEVSWVRPFSDQRGFHGMVIKFLSLDPGSDAILARVLAAKEDSKRDSFDPARIAEDTLPDDQIETTPFISPRKLLPDPGEPKTSRRIALPGGGFPAPPRLPAPPAREALESPDEIATRRAPRLDPDEAATRRAQALKIQQEDSDEMLDSPTGDATRQYRRPEQSFLSSFKTSTHIRIYTRAMPQTPDEQDAELERLAEESGLASLEELVSWAQNAIRGTPRDPASIERELVALAVAAKKE